MKLHFRFQPRFHVLWRELLSVFLNFTTFPCSDLWGLLICSITHQFWHIFEEKAFVGIFSWWASNMTGLTAIGPYDDILTTLKKRNLKWFGHVSRSAGITKTILPGTVQGGRGRGRQKKRWKNNISEWTGLKFWDALRESELKTQWRERVARSVALQRLPWPWPWIGARCKILWHKGLRE